MSTLACSGQPAPTHYSHLRSMELSWYSKHLHKSHSGQHTHKKKKRITVLCALTGRLVTKSIWKVIKWLHNLITKKTKKAIFFSSGPLKQQNIAGSAATLDNRLLVQSTRVQSLMIQRWRHHCGSGYAWMVFLALKAK